MSDGTTSVFEEWSEEERNAWLADALRAEEDRAWFEEHPTRTCEHTPADGESHRVRAPGYERRLKRNRSKRGKEAAREAERNFRERMR